MCGIFGIVSRPGRFSESEIIDALSSIHHRGPDDYGVQKIATKLWDVWLGHKRLSILDLSKSGHQPMSGQTREGKHGWIVYNGESYNFSDFKNELSENWQFSSTSDTEVLLAGLLHNGPEMLKSINGMLALGMLDTTDNSLTLARDRLGKKPLYIYQDTDLIAFSSELKPFHSLGLPLSINQDALSFYQWLGYIPHKMTIYNQCIKLPAANYATIDLNQNSLNLVEKQYWDSFSGFESEFTGTYEDAIEEFLFLLDDATSIRLISDVPVGIFLSGGVDSSLVAASVQKIKPGQITAFTVKFEDKKFDESDVAISTAKQLGINLELLNLKSEDFTRQIDKISWHFDEPFSDSSQIPTLAIAESARKHVTVVLTGDGGDEVFLGYPRYSFLLKLEKFRRLISILPFAKKLAYKSLHSKSGKSLITGIIGGFGGNVRKIDSSINRISAILDAESIAEVYDSIMSIHQKMNVFSAKQIKDNKIELFKLVRSWYPEYNWDKLDNRSIQEQVAALDMVSFMRDDVLVKVDRATMAYSLEARSPLLDYRIIEFGNSLPLEFKLHNGVHKRILRDALAKRLKGEISGLKKSGFDVPLPKNLPEAASPQASWNIFIQKQWEKIFLN